MIDDILKVWPNWNIVRTIGEGSFGKVFEICRNEYGIEEHSALKVVSIPQSDSEMQALLNDGMREAEIREYFKGTVDDFVKEIQLMIQLRGNSNIVGYQDFAVVEKTDTIGFDILIRMELLTGLPNYLRNNRFRVCDVIQLGVDICSALEVCRGLNIVHRDIKPDNIFVSDNGYFKLGDFGVARTIEKTMAGLSRKGTYSYMAPEIYNGDEYGFESDIYSLGIVLYKLLNNNRDPFLPDYPQSVKYSDKTDAMVKRISGMEMPKPANADENLKNIIFKACAFKPSERYKTPSEFKKALEEVAVRYSDLQNEVFSENGINFYTNDSVFGTSSKSISFSKSQSESNGEEENEEPGTSLLYEIEPTSDDGTMLLADADDDGGTMLLDTDFDSGFYGGGLNSVDDPILDYSGSMDLDENDSGHKKYCAFCGNEIKQEYKFCGRCGQKINNDTPITKTCLHCGNVLKPEAKFCGKCGTKVTVEEAF